MRQFQQQLRQKLEMKQKHDVIVPTPPVRKATTCLQSDSRLQQAGHQTICSERVSPYSFPQRGGVGCSVAAVGANRSSALMDWNEVSDHHHHQQQQSVVMRSCVG